MQAAAGEFTFTPPQVTGEGKVRVSDVNDMNIYARNRTPFTVQPAKALQLVSPNGGEIFNTGQEISITWEATSVAAVNLAYSLDGGTDWDTIRTETNADADTLLWVVPDNSTDRALIRVRESGGTLIDQSDSTLP